VAPSLLALGNGAVVTLMLLRPTRLDFRRAEEERYEATLRLAEGQREVS
jgi:hypothetical protein